MTRADGRNLIQKLAELGPELTPKARLAADFVTAHPKKAVFMRTRELAAAAGVSEATVVRFVNRLGYDGYLEFIQDLREYVDAELTLLDRVDLTGAGGPGAERLRRAVFEEIDNLTKFYESLDLEAVDRAVDLLLTSRSIYVVGSRVSYTFAYYMGWSLTKIRSGVRILKGSDSTAIDWLTIADPDSLVVVFAASRWPNELIRLAKLVRRLDLNLIVVTDSAICPVLQFADLALIARSQHFPLIGSPTPINCLTNCLIAEMVGRDGDRIREHQQKLEQVYLEQDLLFNLTVPPPED